MLKSWQLADAMRLREAYDSLHRFIESMNDRGVVIGGDLETGLNITVVSHTGAVLRVHKDDYPDAVKMFMAIAQEQMSDIADRLREMGVVAEADPGRGEKSSA
jgi:hypothetical protein